MNRRGFLRLFGLGVSALLVAPKMLVAQIKNRIKPRKIKPVGKWVQRQDPINIAKVHKYYNKRKEHNRNITISKLEELV